MQKLKFSVYDIDNVTDTLDDDIFLGSLECTLGEVCACFYHCFLFSLNMKIGIMLVIFHVAFSLPHLQVVSAATYTKPLQENYGEKPQGTITVW